MERVAAHVGSEHTCVTLRPDDLLAAHDDAFAAMDQPTFDGLNTYVVSRAAAQAGLKVALSGLGADELFDGYGSASRIAMLERARRLPRPVARVAGRAAGVAMRDGNREKLASWLGRRRVTASRRTNCCGACSWRTKCGSSRLTVVSTTTRRRIERRTRVGAGAGALHEQRAAARYGRDEHGAQPGGARAVPRSHARRVGAVAAGQREAAPPGRRCSSMRRAICCRRRSSRGASRDSRCRWRRGCAASFGRRSSRPCGIRRTRSPGC